MAGSKDSTPDLTGISDLATRQALLSSWSALNAIRAEKRVLDASVESLQREIRALQSGATASAKLPAIVSLLNSQVNIAQDHPCLFLGNAPGGQSVASGSLTPITWDTKLREFGGDFFVSPSIVAIERKPGIWLSGLNVQWTASALGTFREIRIIPQAGNSYWRDLRFPVNPSLGGGFYNHALFSIHATSGLMDAATPGAMEAMALHDAGVNLNAGGIIWAWWYLGPLGP